MALVTKDIDIDIEASTCQHQMFTLIENSRIGGNPICRSPDEGETIAVGKPV